MSSRAIIGDEENLLNGIESAVDHIRYKEYQFGEHIRNIPIKILRNIDSKFKAEAFIMMDTNNEILCIRLIDMEHENDHDEYYISFYSEFMSEERQDWLAGFLANQLYDTVIESKRNLKQRMKRKINNVLKIVGIETLKGE